MNKKGNRKYKKREPYTHIEYAVYDQHDFGRLVCIGTREEVCYAMGVSIEEFDTRHRNQRINGRYSIVPTRMYN